jgi:dienelactone hydrolase
MVIDSPGHSFEGDAKIERRGAGTHFDPRLISGSTTADTVYVWDLMRAVDYLETRPEADTSRIGITGTSGGGHATMFAFAADERFTCAVPACYPSSFLDMWDNGCDCNHVPGYVQVGDRADVIAIRAPAPVFVIGAKDDPEFPAIGTQHTGEKLQATWKLFGAERDAWWRLFDGEHGYSQPMREAALGFFDLYLKKKGDGSPVAEAPMKTEEPEAPELFCLPDPPKHQLTMRDIARANVERAGNASWDDVIALNGGAPERAPLDFTLLSSPAVDGARFATFVSERGLTVPGLLYEPASPRGAIVLVDERGKTSAKRDFPIDALVAHGLACFAIDARGTGELEGLDPKLLSYLGAAQSFLMGWDAARAAEAMLARAPKVAIVGKGACGSLAALYAGLFEKHASLVVGIDALEKWSDLFDDDVPIAALEPRVGYGASLARLRSLFARPIEWYPRKGPSLDLAKLLDAKLAQ